MDYLFHHLHVSRHFFIYGDNCTDRLDVQFEEGVYRGGRTQIRELSLTQVSSPPSLPPSLPPPLSLSSKHFRHRLYLFKTYFAFTVISEFQRVFNGHVHDIFTTCFIDFFFFNNYNRNALVRYNSIN